MCTFSNRFNDLGLIKEQDEDGQSELGSLNPLQPLISLDSTDLSVEGQGTTEVENTRASSCPFGERIAQEREKKEQEEAAARKNANHRVFPQNIIQLQAAEKQKAAKRRTTAGVNPSAGKEKGNTFITTRNYLNSLTENTLSLKPGGLYKKTFDVSKVSPGSTNTVQPGTIYCPSPDFNNYTKSDVVNDTHSKHRYSSSFPAPVLVSEQNPPLYRPDPVLSKTVNPHLAPSLQLHGSASYKLKPTPQEFITQIDSNPTFKDNHYTHTLSVKEEAKGVSGSPLPVPDTVNISDISIGDFEPATSQGEEKVPKCQFLRDNFPSPEPISKDTLYHIEPSSIKPLYKHIVNSSTNFQPVIVSAAPSIPIASTVPISIASFPSHPHGSPGFTAPIAAASSLKKESFPQQSVNILTPRQPPPASSSTAAVRTMAGCNAMSGYSAANFMSGGHEMSSTRDIYTTVAPQSRVQEKEELQRLNDRFSAYVGRVRQLGQQTNHVDTSAFLRSTKILEDEILHLKSMYEGELDKLR